MAKGKTSKANPQKPYWEMIERHYRSGILSVRTIASQFGITEGAIRKKVKAEGWQRDLADKVREAAKEKLVRSDGTQSGTHSNAKDKEIIENASEVVAAVGRNHRKTIGKGRELVEGLIAELHDASVNRAEIQEAIMEETEDDKDYKCRNRLLKAVSLPVRSGVMLNLSAAIKNLITLERTAFNMDEQAKAGETTFEQHIFAAIERRNERRKNGVAPYQSTS